jgi:general secretion pathway protein D
MHSIKPISTLILATLLFSGCTAGRTGFSKAQKLEREGNIDAALVKYAEVTSANPEVGEYRVGFLKATDAAARAHFKKGDVFFAQKNYDDALREYQSAYAIDPTQIQAKQQSDLLLRIRNAQTYYLEGVAFEKERKPREAMVAYKHALEFDPANKQIKESMDRLLLSKRTKLDGYELNLKSTKPITLKFKDAKIKEIFSILSQLSGVNFVFDDAVKDVNVSLFLENASFQQALDILTGMQKLGKKVLNESTIILYPKSPEKFKQYEELFVQTFYLNKLDAKKAVNLIRTMLQVKKIYVNEEMNALVLRDTPEVVEVARKILEANDVPDAEVLLEVEVFELSKQNAETFGMALSKYSVTAGITGPSGKFLTDSLSTTTTTSTTGGSVTTTVAETGNLLNVFAVKGYNGYLTVPNATFNFGKTLSNGETLSNPKIRVKNREKAKFNVGTRVPITTTSSPSGGGVSVNVQYVDVGVKVNAEPTIQLNNEVSIKLGLEVSSILQRDTIGTDQATTVVTIGTRNLDTVLSLKDGETSIIGGLIQKNKTDSKGKVSFLGDIPFLGALFTNTNDSANKSEIMLAITPRIVRGVTVPENDVSAFWSGREDEPSSNKPYSSFTQDADLIPAAPAAAGPNGAAPGAGAPATALPAFRRPVTPAAPAATAPGPAAAAPLAQPSAAVSPENTKTPDATAPAAAGTAAPMVLVPAVPAPAAQTPAAQTPAAQASVAQTPVPQAPAVQAPAGQAPAAQVSAPPAASALVPGNGAVTPNPLGSAVPAPPTPVSSAPAAVVPVPSGAPAAVPSAKGAPAPARKAAPTAPVALSLDAPATVQLNDQFSVQINAIGANNLYNAVFVVKYPKNLEVQTQAEGPFLKQNGVATMFQAFNDKKKGQIWVSQSRTAGIEGASGNGVLATVTFKAIGKGTTPISLANTNFTNKAGDPFVVNPSNRILEVQ